MEVMNMFAERSIPAGIGANRELLSPSSPEIPPRQQKTRILRESRGFRSFREV
jgi:hypothetical protein